MLRWIVLLCLAPLALPQNVDDYKAYSNAAEWTGNISYSLQATWDYSMGGTQYKGEEYERGMIVMRLDQFNNKTGTSVEWLGMGSTQAWRSSKAGSYTKDSSYETSKSVAASFPSKGWLLMDLAKGTFNASATTAGQACEQTVRSKGKGYDKTKSEKVHWVPQTAHTIYHEALPKPAPGMVLSGSKTDHDVHHVNIGSSKGQLDFNAAWTLAPVWRDLELIVTVDDYERWLPEGNKDGKSQGNSTKVHAELKSKDGKPVHLKAKKITFELLNTSKEPGVCLNWPPPSGDDAFDLRFVPDATSLPEDDKFQKVFSVGDKMIKADAVLGAHDWGASAELRATAELEDGRVVVGHLDGQPDRVHVLLPKRQSYSKVADAWKTDHGHPIEEDDAWDEDGAPKPAKVKGDGLTLFEEYRGAFLLDGKHSRLDPDRMELFVLDPDKLLDPELWKKVTGAAALLLTDEQHLKERVNFNSSSKPKYAVHMRKVNGIIDPTGEAPAIHHWGDTKGKIADETTAVRIFVDRPAYGLKNIFHPDVKKALADPQSVEGKRMYGDGMDKPLLEGADRALSDPALLSKLLGRLVQLVVIHELCHACAVEHHAPDDARGDLTCLMRNFDGHDKMSRMAHELMTPSPTLFPLAIDKLCSAPDDCWGQLRMKPK